MKNNYKRLLSVFLLVVMILTILPVKNVQAQEETWEAFIYPSSYEGGTGHDIYIRTQGDSSMDNARVGYCFNSNQNYPTSLNNKNLPKYTKVIGTPETFQDHISWKRVKDNLSIYNVNLDTNLDSEYKDGKTYREYFNLSKYAKIDKSTTGQFYIYDYRSRLYDEDLQKAILKVLYNGYTGKDRTSNLQKALGASDEDLRVATQAAVWYFTDSLNITNVPKITSIQENIANILVGITPNDAIEEVPSNATLNLYTHLGTNLNQYNPKFSTYQHILGSQFIDEKGIPIKPVPEEPNTTKVNFSKKALTEDGKELAGAEIEIVKKDGEVVKSWTSTGEVKTFDLEDGDYIFKEKAAPVGYELATDISFTVKDGKVTVGDTVVTGNTVVMVDKLKDNPVPEEPNTTKVNFSKKALTEDGKELAGAEVELVKKDGEVVKSWTSTGEVKTFDLEDGDYIFKEKVAPEGYELATDISFTVKDGKVTVGDTVVTGNTVVMVDKLKVTEGNNDNNGFITKKYNSYRPSNLRKLPKTGYNAFPYEVIMLLTGTFLVLNKNKKNK